MKGTITIIEKSKDYNKPSKLFIGPNIFLLYDKEMSSFLKSGDKVQFSFVAKDVEDKVVFTITQIQKMVNSKDINLEPELKPIEILFVMKRIERDMKTVLEFLEDKENDN
jgi:hypothetical protein